VSDSGTKTQSRAPLMLRLSKVFADPLRMKILAELNRREMSPKQFFDEFGGGSIARVSRHFDVLTEYDWLYLVRTESGGRRRGAIEHFYRAIEPAVFDSSIWPSVPDSMKELVTWRIFETFAGQVKEALEAGTIDAREDRHFTWTPLRLDQRGWENVIARTDALFHFLFEEQEEANLRMAESGEAPTPMTVGLAAFESPKDSVKAP
jgi:DNA-binding transcriptional ArsR family regulator